jgi:hypothetical protein
MLQAITTKYIGPTNVRGSRVKATAAAGSLTLGWDHALNPEANHLAAAQAFARKLGWTGTFHGGAPHEQSSYVWVNATDHKNSSFTLTEQKVPFALGTRICTSQSK